MRVKVRFLIGLAWILVPSGEMRAQATDHRLEVGMQYTALKLSVFDSVESGIGGRFGVRANRTRPWGRPRGLPTTGVIILADIGDTIIRFNDDTFFTFPFPTRVPDGFSHNLQVTVGVGLRF